MPEKDFAAIAASKIVKPSQVKRQPRILIYGRNKKGKSTFCASAPNVLIADPEQGTDWMTGVDPDVWPIRQWEDLAELYGFLRSGQHKYEWVALDGLSRMNDMALDYTMRVREERSIDAQPGMVAQKDWGQAGKVMKTMLVNFFNLDSMGVIFTAQERVLEGDSGEADEEAEDAPQAYVANLPAAPRSTVNSLADVIGRIYVVRTTNAAGTEVTERRLWLGESALYDTGGRSEHKLPDYLRRPTVPRLTELLETGKVAARRTAK